MTNAPFIDTVLRYSPRGTEDKHDMLQLGCPISGFCSNPASFCCKANTLQPCQPTGVQYCVTARTRTDCLTNTNTARERSVMNVVMLNTDTPLLT